MKRLDYLAALGVLALASCSTDPVTPRLVSSGPLQAISMTGAEIITENEIARQAENTAPTKNWVLYTRNAGTGTFRVGPGTVPEGVGSMEFNTPASADKAYLYNFDYTGLSLADLATLRYSSYRSAAPGAAVVSLNIVIDRNGGATDPADVTYLVWEPYLNTAQGSIVNFTWQSWDAIYSGNGRWWASGTGIPACVQGTPCTWTTLLGYVPTATVLGLGLNQGSGNPGTISSFDKLVVAFGANPATTYDFEPWVTPTTREVCKQDGWTTAKRADGSSFKNQGDCVSYVETGK